VYENKLVIPDSLQRKVIELAYEGHKGVVKTKQLLRDKVWFPRINKQVEDICRQCIPCLACTPSNNQEPLLMTELPSTPWSRVSADFCGPFPTGEYLLFVIDDHSRYPVVEII
jgi:hypothetical protein